MSRVIFLLFFSLFSTSSFSQTFISENKKLETLCKVWGFLKYYHPYIVKGGTEWDQQLVKHIPLVILNILDKVGHSFRSKVGQ